MSLITLKLKHECDKKDRILELIKNYNSFFFVFTISKISSIKITINGD